MALLEVEGVTTGYAGGPDILRDMNLTVEAGRSYCIIGPNGAGKSTLLKAIAGTLRLRSGEIRLEGRSLGSLRPDQRLEAGVCFVPQDPSIFPEMTVLENLRMGGYLLHDAAETGRRVDEVMDRFPMLRERSAQLAGTLSGGQQQILLIGRSLIIRPRIMMIDEPSLGLSPILADEIFSAIRSLGDLGITVLMVEQSVARGLGSTDWGFVLDLGSMRFEGPSSELLRDGRIRDLYMGTTASGAADARGEA